MQYAGASTVSKEKILANMRTRVGRPYSEQVVEEDIRNLYTTGNISNVRIFGEPLTDGVKVIVVVQSKAQITEVRLNGVHQGQGEPHPQGNHRQAGRRAERGEPRGRTGRRSPSTTRTRASPRWT